MFVRERGARREGGSNGWALRLDGTCAVASELYWRIAASTAWEASAPVRSWPFGVWLKMEHMAPLHAVRHRGASA